MDLHPDPMPGGVELAWEGGTLTLTGQSWRVITDSLRAYAAGEPTEGGTDRVRAAALADRLQLMAHQVGTPADPRQVSWRPSFHMRAPEPPAPVATCIRVGEDAIGEWLDTVGVRESSREDVEAVGNELAGELARTLDLVAELQRKLDEALAGDPRSSPPE